MLVLAYSIEALSYAIKIILIVSFWLVILVTTFNWLKVPNASPWIRVMRKLIEPTLLLIKKKFPFLVQAQIDFTPMLVVFLIMLMHLIIVDPLFDLAQWLKT